MYANPVSYLYVCTDTYNSTAYDKSKSFRKPRKSSRKPRKSSKKSTFFFKRKLDENEDIRPLKKQKNKFQNNFKFPHIHIKLENIEYHFIPHRFYKVIHSKETRHKFNYVVIYQISRNEVNIEPLISYIPYYISDGNTNYLRANLLFPFICFNSRNSEDLCPTIHNKLGLNGLLKLSLQDKVKLMNTERVDQWVNTEMLKWINDYKTKLKPSDLGTVNQILFDIQKHRSVDIGSVLSRLHNFLDFLILIYCEEINGFENKVSLKYHPIIPTNDYEINEEDKYNMNFIDNRKPSNFQQAIQNDYRNEYRRLLLYIFQSEQKNFNKLLGNNLEIEYVNLDYTEINTINFNNVFLREYEKYTLPDQNKNSCNYAKISVNLNIDILNVASGSSSGSSSGSTKNRYQTLLQSSRYDYNIYNNILHELNTNENVCRNILPTNINGWIKLNSN
jgi:hypothetical protein